MSLNRFRPMAEINVTPMVDVMLVLLVIFVVTAPMLTVGVEVELPSADAPPLTQDIEPIVVAIDARGRATLGHRAAGPAALEKRLAAIAARRPEVQVFVRADGRAPYAAVARVLAAIERAGITRVALVTTPERR